jgi:hypothetical protein
MCAIREPPAGLQIFLNCADRVATIHRRSSHRSLRAAVARRVRCALPAPPDQGGSRDRCTVFYRRSRHSHADQRCACTSAARAWGFPGLRRLVPCKNAWRRRCKTGLCCFLVGWFESFLASADPHLGNRAGRFPDQSCHAIHGPGAALALAVFSGVRGVPYGVALALGGGSVIVLPAVLPLLSMR